VSGPEEKTAKAAKNAKCPDSTAGKQEQQQTAATRLLKQTTGSIPRSDAEYLLMHLLAVKRHELYTGTPVSPAQSRRFSRMVATARTGKPVQYIVRSAPFLDLDLYVDQRVLIPRPETEELVIRALGRLGSVPNRPALVVDYGTGSGCIAIALARRLADARLIAVDASKSALAVALRNVQACHLGRRVRLVHARNLDVPTLRRLRGRVDLLISNPPYVPSARIAILNRRVREHEPRLSLDGGPKGTSIVGMLLEQGPRLLRPGGLLAVEIDSSHGRFVRRLAPTAEVEKDLAGRVRYVFLRRNT